MKELDKLVNAGGREPTKRGELAQIVTGLHTIEEAVRAPMAEFLELITAHLPSAPVASASQNWTTDQEAVLRAAGSFVDEMPPLAQRASTRTAQRIVEMLSTALTTEEAASRLDVTSPRVRQRLSSGTLLGVKVGAAYRLPAFQFTQDGELPGWAHVADAVPRTAHPVSIARFMGTPHPDLTVAGEALSPSDWLLGGGDPDRIARMITTAFVVHSS